MSKKWKKKRRLGNNTLSLKIMGYGIKKSDMSNKNEISLLSFLLLFIINGLD